MTHNLEVSQGRNRIVHMAAGEDSESIPTQTGESARLKLPSKTHLRCIELQVKIQGPFAVSARKVVPPPSSIPHVERGFLV